MSEVANFSIDIVRTPVPEKWNAMQDYLTTVLKDVKAQEGVYFGNQNQYPDDRDGCMQKIAGLKVLAVDQKQESVTAGVKSIGTGPEATLKQLQEYATLAPDKRPRFIGFDVDDTILGLRSDKLAVG